MVGSVDADRTAAVEVGSVDADRTAAVEVADSTAVVVLAVGSIAVEVAAEAEATLAVAAAGLLGG